MKRAIVMILGVVAIGLALAYGASFRLGAEPLPLCAGAVQLRDQVQTFTRLRVYLTVVPLRSKQVHAASHPWILHARSDGVLALDTRTQVRFFWDKQALWRDRQHGNENPPPKPFDHSSEPYINAMFEAFRSSSTAWIARSQGYYGWGSRDAWQSTAELVNELWSTPGMHVFFQFADGGTIVHALEVRDQDGRVVFKAAILRVDFNPTLPGPAFSANAPPIPVFFPEVCGNGSACPDSWPPGPTGPPPP